MASTLIASVTTQLVGKIVDKQGARLLGCWGVILTASASFGLAWQLVPPPACLVHYMIVLKPANIPPLTLNSLDLHCRDLVTIQRHRRKPVLAI